jgi:hypothetical protein
VLVEKYGLQERETGNLVGYEISPALLASMTAPISSSTNGAEEPAS